MTKVSLEEAKKAGIAVEKKSENENMEGVEPAFAAEGV